MSRPLAAHDTVPAVARLMVQWALQPGSRRVLEPSCGDGAFLDAVRELDAEVEVLGVDVRPRYSGRGPGLSLRQADFLTLPPDASFQSVVGNPPYVRLRDLPPVARQAAESAMSGIELSESASIWLPFVVHATRFLAPGGRMALVLPLELTYVRYAHPLWRFLGASYGRLGVIRVRQWLFAGLDQETVIFLASGRGGTTARVSYEAVDTLEDAKLLKSGDGVEAIPIQHILDGERPFTGALLAARPRRLLRQLTDGGALRPLRDLAEVHIGYVAGDKRFFHPDGETVRRFGLPPAHLRPTVVSTRGLRGQGLMPVPQTFLYTPDPGALTPGDRAYIAHGEATGVAERYKCRIRTPWFVVPAVRAPDLILPVFADVPLLFAGGGCTASNSLMCGYLRDPDPGAEIVAATWYNTASMLSAELFVHHLGGGVLILVPQEAQRLLLPVYRPSPPAERWLATLRSIRLREQVADAVAAGDRYVLQATHGLTNGDVDVLRGALDAMRGWRRNRGSGKPLPAD